MRINEVEATGTKAAKVSGAKKKKNSCWDILQLIRLPGNNSARYMKQFHQPGKIMSTNCRFVLK